MSSGTPKKRKLRDSASSPLLFDSQDSDHSSEIHSDQSQLSYRRFNRVLTPERMSDDSQLLYPQFNRVLTPERMSDDSQLSYPLFNRVLTQELISGPSSTRQYSNPLSLTKVSFVNVCGICATSSAHGNDSKTTMSQRMANECKDISPNEMELAECSMIPKTISTSDLEVVPTIEPEGSSDFWIGFIREQSKLIDESLVSLHLQISEHMILANELRSALDLIK